MDARTTTRLGKVLSFFGVLVLVLGLLQSGADASGKSLGKGSAPGWAKKQAPATTAAPAGNSANTDCGSYCSTSDGTPSGNGNGDGNATGKPCGGCVGNADDKNPPGQYKDGGDNNNGYECDGNNGIAKTNPAHTGCQPTTTVAPTTTAPPQTTTTVAQQTTTTAPPQTTTTAPPGTTTTVAVDGNTTTTSDATVLGVQFSRGGEQVRGLASTGAPFFRPFTMLGALMLLLGVALMIIKVRPQAQA